MSRRIIQLFEHDHLKLGDLVAGVRIDERDLTLLCRLHSRTKERFFELTHKGVKFSEYVGVIQAGSLIIEVLPKAAKHLSRDSKPEEKRPWRTFFSRLLAKVGLIPGELGAETYALLQAGSLLDLYVAHFLQEVQKLAREGLLRAYSPRTRERFALKGQIVFAKQLLREACGKVGFETKSLEYDSNHQLNRILVTALRVIRCSHHSVLIKDMLPNIEEVLFSVKPARISQDTFQRISYDRKSERYRLAIALAKPILLSMFPGVRAGDEETVSLMFNMNTIWERYVLSEVRRAAPAENFCVESQVRETFWESRTLRPDIVVTCEGERFVIDTKWKALSSPEPSDEDLRQIFAYNQIFDSAHSVLLYPDINRVQSRTGVFKGSLNRSGERVNHRCTVKFAQAWIRAGDEYRLNPGLGAEVLKSLKSAS